MTFDDHVIKSDTKVARFRLWQPRHHGLDQWAIDDFIIKTQVQMSSLQADFVVSGNNKFYIINLYFMEQQK